MPISDTERISRFLLRRGWFSKDRVKVDAFIPPKDLQLSVSCTEGLVEEEVWLLGRAVVSSRTDNVSLQGRADLSASVIRKQNLEVERDDNPIRHAIIIGWPAADQAAQRMKALELAAASRLVSLDQA